MHSLCTDALETGQQPDDPTRKTDPCPIPEAEAVEVHEPRVPFFGGLLMAPLSPVQPREAAPGRAGGRGAAHAQAGGDRERRGSARLRSGRCPRCPPPAPRVTPTARLQQGPGPHMALQLPEQRRGSYTFRRPPSPLPDLPGPPTRTQPAAH